MEEKDLLTALGFFKDWTNYMLVTTVAALGWAASTEGESRLRSTTIFCFAASIVMAIFTLALIPLVAEQVLATRISMYDAKVSFYLAWLWQPTPWPVSLKFICWWQHVFFIAGIACYAWWRASAKVELRTDRPELRSAAAWRRDQPRSKRIGSGT